MSSFSMLLKDELVSLDQEKNELKAMLKGLLQVNASINFSSNGLYKDRNDVDIIKKMHDTDRYEWKYISNNKKITKKASRIIFLRDIFKIFYIRGISKENDSADKVINLLAKLTEGMDVIVAGSSAGAYMALLLGNMLPNTRRVLTLGGVVDLESFRSFSSYLDNNLSDCDYAKISDRLFGDYWIINFYGKNNVYDGYNGKLIQTYANNDKLINIAFDIDSHAPRPSGDDLIKLLICNDNHLEKLQKTIKLKDRDCVSQTHFSTYNIGLIKTYYNKLKIALVKIFKNHYEKKS